jgi:hypothetical protein
MVVEKFNLFVNTCLQTVKSNRKTHEELAIRRETENKNYKQLLVKLYEYEKTGLDYYAQVDLKSPLNERRLIFDEVDSTMLPEKQATEDYGNPYRVMYRWIVNEI